MLGSNAMARQSPFGRGTSPPFAATIPLCIGGIGGRVFHAL